MDRCFWAKDDKCKLIFFPNLVQFACYPFSSFFAPRLGSNIQKIAPVSNISKSYSWSCFHQNLQFILVKRTSERFIIFMRKFTTTKLLKPKLNTAFINIYLTSNFINVSIRPSCIAVDFKLMEINLEKNSVLIYLIPRFKNW